MKNKKPEIYNEDVPVEFAFDKEQMEKLREAGWMTTSYIKTGWNPNDPPIEIESY